MGSACKCGRFLRLANHCTDLPASRRGDRQGWRNSLRTVGAPSYVLLAVPKEMTEGKN